MWQCQTGDKLERGRSSEKAHMMAGGRRALKTYSCVLISFSLDFY